jgi:arabinose-5-phosphate isomerase
MDDQSIHEAALRTIQLEAGAISGLQQYVNADFVKAVKSIASIKGRLVISGIGKSAIVAQKIVSTLNSTGTPAIFMHAAEGIHGDLGMVLKEDQVMIISKSGESPEIKALYQLIKNFGNLIIGMSGNDQSFLARNATIFLNTTVSKEACPNNLAPTSSTTAQMVMGDALAIALMEIKGFNSDDFARFHPGGALGKKLYLRVQDIYIQNGKPKVLTGSTLKAVIMEITSKRLGATAVVDEENILRGIITDGDLRRMLEKDIAPGKVQASEIMTRNPATINASSLAIDALELLKSKDINQLIVMENDQYAGFIHLHDLVKEGIF